ncbi:inorganic pyrophosphatase [Immersiella caudata]|uniref:inorganic diphosphatase n=1 Tax=Immersiella caudata TaxID=314043 RepID=A0AA40BUS5_9PEZI|nr:inorganic pyrophosphatase [Immersiella caudata]
MNSKPRPKPEYNLRKRGRPFTNSHRIYFEHLSSHIPISSVHDIPLIHTHHHDQSKIYNMITLSLLLPLPHPTHISAYTAQSTPTQATPSTMALSPQTWESPFHDDPSTGIKGDNDPLDAVGIGKRISHTMEAKAVKVLGVLGLVDQGEMDWKVVVIDAEDEMAGRVEEVPSGGEPNDYAFKGEFRGREFAETIIDECHVVEEAGNTTLVGTPGKMDPDDTNLPPNEDLSPAPHRG